MTEGRADGLRIREAVRAVLIDPDDRVLLVRFEFPAGTRWAMPGGGVEPGEDPIVSLRRELLEEVGLDDPAIGAHVWDRLAIIPFPNGMWDGQRERFHLVRTHRFDPTPVFTSEQLAAELVFELRWWTLDEIVDAVDAGVVFAPRTLPDHLAALLAGQVPNTPVDVGL